MESEPIPEVSSVVGFFYFGGKMKIDRLAVEPVTRAVFSNFRGRKTTSEITPPFYFRWVGKAIRKSREVRRAIYLLDQRYQKGWLMASLLICLPAFYFSPVIRVREIRQLFGRPRNYRAFYKHRRNL